jgi:hypothetical protein
MATTKKAEEQRFAKDLEFTDSYVFNKDTRQYIVFLKSAGKTIVVDETTHKSMMNAYCGEDERTVEEIAATHSFPRSYFDEYKRIFGWVREGMPITDEDILEGDTEHLVQDLLEKKRFEISQKFQKKSWKITQENSTKWIQFEDGVLRPFEKFIENIKPLPTKKISKLNLEGEHLIVGLSDVHYGAHSDSRYLFNKDNKGWSLDDTNKAIDDYAAQLLRFVKSKRNPIQSSVIFSVGDILQTLSGKTAKGTEIEAWPLAEGQFDAAFNSLAKFIQYMSEILPVNKIVSLAGNHSIHDTTLFKCLAAYFRTYEGIKFEIHDARWCIVNVGGCGIIAEHGSSPYYKSSLPKEGSARDAYIQKLVLEKREELKDVKQIIYLSADQHHFEMNERGHFTQVMFSTVVARDRYANDNNLRGRAQQNSLIIDNMGLKEVVSFYLGQ